MKVFVKQYERLKVSLFVSLVVVVSLAMFGLKFEPAEDESAEGLEFVNEIVGGAVPKEYIPAVEKGIEEQMQNGVLAGYPLLG